LRNFRKRTHSGRFDFQRNQSATTSPFFTSDGQSVPQVKVTEMVNEAVKNMIAARKEKEGKK
jgi:hypothetical protein